MDDRTDGRQLTFILVLHRSNKHRLNNAELSLCITHSSICICLTEPLAIHSRGHYFGACQNAENSVKNNHLK